MRNKFFTILGTTVLLFTTAACGNPATSASSPGASSNITSPQVVADDGDPVAPHIATLSGSPLAEYMSLMWNLGASREDQIRANDARTLLIQETAAACMREQGFDYYLDMSSGIQFQDGDPDLWHPEDREWVAQWGFGQVIAPTLNPWMQFMTMGEDSPNAQFWVDQEDPTPEQWAWQTAFHGGPDYEANPGCWALAQRAGWAAEPSTIVQEAEEFRPLFDAMQIMNDRIHNEMGDYEREWVQCMADAGYPGFEQQWEPAESIRQEMSREFGNMFEPFVVNSGVDIPTAASELHEREIELALADFDCRAAVDYEAREQQRRWAAEAQFVADHRPALEALRNTVEQLTASG